MKFSENKLYLLPFEAAQGALVYELNKFELKYPVFSFYLEYRVKY